MLFKSCVQIFFENCEMAEGIPEHEYIKIDQLYDECLDYLRNSKCAEDSDAITDLLHKDEVKFTKREDGTHNLEETDDDYDVIEDNESEDTDKDYQVVEKGKDDPEDMQGTDRKVVDDEGRHYEVSFKVIDELKSSTSITSLPGETKSERLRRFSQQLPKIIITQSNTSLDVITEEKKPRVEPAKSVLKKTTAENNFKHQPSFRNRTAYGEFPKRLISKNGVENVALISNVPFEKIRLLNDTFHTLINLRWRWIVIGTVVMHFAIWLVFAVFWYVTAWAHYDFEPDPPKRTCVTGGKDFVTIFLASVEAQTTIGFGDRAIDEECPESIFLFIMQLILGTGLSGVLTCVVYAKLTRPEKLSRDGVGFSKKAVISMRDGKLCLMFRAWDLNYDHIISSEFNAHFVHTYRTAEGEVVRYLARSLRLQQRQFLLWPVTLLHVIDSASPLYHFSPHEFANGSYEITLSLKGASASMGTFTQSQTSYVPREVIWGHRFPPVVKYDLRKQKYVVEHAKLDLIEKVDTPICSASELYSSTTSNKSASQGDSPGTPGSFSKMLSSFQLERASSFKRKDNKS